ncbi:MAG TPA: tetratricopeptide repeat protein [Gammaproteobacteria bacterium]
MSDLKQIVDATPENFAELVIGNSMRGPVMVNFWSAKAGPCIKLWPLLEKLATEYSGKFLLVNLNTDKHGQFARSELGITSVPTVKMYRNQQVVDVIHGAESENSFRNMIAKHLPRQSDALILNAVEQYQQNNIDFAFEKLKKLQQNDPANPRIALTLMKLMFREGRLQEMLEYIKTLSSNLRKNEEVMHLATHAQFILAAQVSQPISELESLLETAQDNIEQRFQLSAQYLIADRYTDAMDQLLKIIQLDRSYKDDIGVKGMVCILNIMGSDTDMTKKYRKKMIDVISA